MLIFKYLFTRLNHDRVDHITFYFLVISIGLFSIFHVLVLTGICSPVQGFKRFDIRFLIGGFIPTLAVFMLNLRNEFDLLTLQEGTSAPSRIIFVGVAISVILTVSTMFVVDILPKIPQCVWFRS